VNPGEHDLVMQELRAIVPIGASGEFQFGARHYWETTGDAKSSIEGAQVYGSVRFRW
jgi:hypothetical protein